MTGMIGRSSSAILVQMGDEWFPRGKRVLSPRFGPAAQGMSVCQAATGSLE